MRYMGCVTDRSWTKAMMEQYPDRKPWSRDSAMRKRISGLHRDIPELATQAVAREACRCQDVPLVDLSQPRWKLVSSHYAVLQEFARIGELKRMIRNDK